MRIKFTDVLNRGDLIKMIILLIISILCWTWVWHEFKKPILPPEWEQELQQTKD